MSRLILIVMLVSSAGCAEVATVLQLAYVPVAVARRLSGLNRGRHGIRLAARPDGLVQNELSAQVLRDLETPHSALYSVWLAPGENGDGEFQVILGFDRSDGCYFDEAWLRRDTSGRFSLVRYGDTVDTHCANL